MDNPDLDGAFPMPPKRRTPMVLVDAARFDRLEAIAAAAEAYHVAHTSGDALDQYAARRALFATLEAT